MNCCDWPKAIVGFSGDSPRLRSCAGVIDSDAVPETVPRVAVIVTDPAARLEARPTVAPVLLIVDNVASEELQRTDAVISCELPSL